MTGPYCYVTATTPLLVPRLVSGTSTSFPHKSTEIEARIRGKHDVLKKEYTALRLRWPQARQAHPLTYNLPSPQSTNMLSTLLPCVSTAYFLLMPIPFALPIFS